MQKISKYIITYFIAITFVISNVGITFYSSCCNSAINEKNKVEQTSCCKTEVVKEMNENCCEYEKSTDHNCINDCENLCFSTYTYVKLDIDQLSIIKQSLETELYFTYIDFDYYSETYNSLYKYQNSNKAPPHNWGRQLVISLQKPKIPAPLSV